MKKTKLPQSPLLLASTWAVVFTLAGFSPAWAIDTGPTVDNDTKTSTESGEVIAKVNGEELFIEDIASVLGEIHSDAAAEERADFQLDRMLFRLVNDTLLAQEARILQMDSDPSLQRRLEGRREELARARLEKEEIRDRVQVDDTEIKRTYEDAFRTASLRIFTRKDRAEAEALRAEVETAKTPEDLEELARSRSQDPYSARGGLMDSAAWLDIPLAIRELAVGMRPGEVAGPVATTLGWTVFRLETIEPADPEQFEARRAQLLGLVRLEKWEALRADLLEQLRSRHEVVVHQDVFDAIGIEAMPDGRLLPKIDDPNAVVVDAGGRPITAAVFGQALAGRWANIGNPDVALALKPILLDSLIVDELMTAEALQRGYGQSPEVERTLHAMQTRLLVNRYLKEVILPQVDVSQEEMRAYYDEHADEFRRPPRLFVSQLTVGSREQAEELAQMLASGTEFAWLARQHSTDGYRDKGGSVGWVAANVGIQGFRRELANAEAGDLFGPKGDADEWRLVKVEAIEDLGVYPFDQVSGNVRAHIEDQAFLELVDSYITRLRANADIWINDEAVASLQIGVTPRSDETGPTAPGHGEH